MTATFCNFPSTLPTSFCTTGAGAVCIQFELFKHAFIPVLCTRDFSEYVVCFQI